MAKYAWCSDTHLNFIDQDPQRLISFAQNLVKDNPTGILITGDISVASKLVYTLSALERIVQRPIFFVLGNHDYYGSSFEQVRKAMRELTNASQFLRYMPTMPYFALTPATAVIGADGWYDALHGDFNRSTMSLNDWTAIRDFNDVSGNKATIVTLCRKIAHESVTHVHDAIKKAVKYHNNIVILTHVPPFREAHVYNGAPGEDNAHPWFVSKYMGDLLLQASQTFPNVNFTVLCGHTHGKTEYKAANNLVVRVAGAEYYNPQTAGILEAA